MANMAPEGIPPELAAMLAGGGGPAPTAGPPGAGDPSGAPGGPVPGAGGQSSADFLAGLIEHAQAYQQVEQDQEDLAVVAKCIAALQQLMAKNQREDDQAMGVGPAQKAMRRSMAEQGGPAGGGPPPGY